MTGAFVPYETALPHRLRQNPPRQTRDLLFRTGDQKCWPCRQSLKSLAAWSSILNKNDLTNARHVTTHSLDVLYDWL